MAPSALNSKLSTINCLIITPKYDSSDLKENGTIPFYRRFLKKVLIRKFRKLTRITSITLVVLL